MFGSPQVASSILLLAVLLASAGGGQPTEGDAPKSLAGQATAGDRQTDNTADVGQNESAQDEADRSAVPVAIKVEPNRLTLGVGQTAMLKVTIQDAEGHALDTPITYFSKSRNSVSISKQGKVTAHRAGSYTVVVMTPASKDRKPLGPKATRLQQLSETLAAGKRLRVSIPIMVVDPPLAQIEFVDAPARVYAGTSVTFAVRGLDGSGKRPPDVKIQLESSDPTVASVDELGRLTAHRLGRFSIVARAGSTRVVTECQVVPNPVRSLTLRAARRAARTGDVLHFHAEPRDALSRVVPDAPIHFSFYHVSVDVNRSAGATGQIDQSGRFVAEKSGTYTIVASSGGRSARATVRIEQRSVRQKIEVVGRAPVRDVHSSDLWIWQGVDGRDYAVTGTWGGDGEVFFWDVSDPAHMQKISTFKVDARTVNDVKVSEDGTICVISREGASNRRNGIVILDVTDPAEVGQLSTFDEGLTGGVHNVFIDKGFVYALNNMRRFDVISIEDPTRPHRVGQFELDTAEHGIHDVWVDNGILYSSNFRDGVYLIDVGNGITGGTPENPVKIDNFVYPNGWSHSAFPYFSQSTGKFYVIGGDEIFPTGMVVKDRPTIAAGYVHFLDFTTPGRPSEAARYEIPEAGSHNFWVDGDILYVAYYNAGLRVVDISGELMGDLYKQGREIAVFRPYDSQAVIPNAAMTWGPQPYKGLIYFIDWNSGLWAVRMVPKE